jgi:hypothetical protein
MYAMMSNWFSVPCSCRYDKTSDQLAAYLNILLAAGKLSLENGIFKRKAAPAKPSEN